MGDTLFHLAFPVHDLKETKKFYVKGLGCRMGRESEHSLVLNLKGNQIVAQLTRKEPSPQKGIYPRHFGLIFKEFKDWQKILRRAQKRKLKFYQTPKIRYPKTPLEHHTFFLQDPSFNLMEFKYYKFDSAIFGKKKFKRVGDSR
jgi:extradiol dioxygenase family protein